MTASDASTRRADPAEDVILRVEDASVSFRMDRGTSTVLDDATIDVRREETLGVVGESGSGKSMFASTLLDAVVEPGRLSGRVTYYPADGEPVSLLDCSESERKRIRWEDISMVFQGAMSSFNPTMTIGGHFRETLKAHDHAIPEGMERGRRLLSDLYLDPERVLDSHPHELSGGMKQRSLIALSLLLDPEVLVMDEPTAALDLLMQRSILGLVRKLKEKYDLTVVFITHDLPLVAGLADRLAVMYAFQFAEVGPTGRVIRNPAHPYTRALLRAVPSVDLPIGEARPIPGSSPDPVNVPQGCPYHPRCPLATDVCEAAEPPLEAVRDDHETACHHWDEVDDDLPAAVEGVE